ncbi:MAG: hypothetical protein AAF772_03535 [Acidobacteriota bacterium]
MHLRLLAITSILLLLTGCLPFFRSAPTPVRVQTFPIDAGPTQSVFQPAADARARCLMMIVPGFFSLPKDIGRHDFPQVVDELGLSIDLVGVDLHIKYANRGTLWERLSTDVVEPARAAGYEEIWMGGMSFGGFATIAYAARNAADLDGMVLLAPYVGGSRALNEIRAAGPLENWTPNPPLKPGKDLRKMWRWYQDWAQQDPATRPLIFLGYGDDDDLAEANQLFARNLDREHVYVRTGGHDWPVWRDLFRDILQDEAFNDCRPDSAASTAR